MNPLPWWSLTSSAEHRAWLEESTPQAVPYEELDAHRMWSAGTPVLLRTDGREHLAFVRLEGAWFAPRWLKQAPHWRVHPVELILRNPRVLWSDAFSLQIALAMVSADPRCAWLTGPFDEEEETELLELHRLAREELSHRRALTPTTGPAPSPYPMPRRAWTKSERDAMRAASSMPPAYVDLAPGRS